MFQTIGGAMSGGGYETDDLHLVDLDEEEDSVWFLRFNPIENQRVLISLGMKFANLKVFKNAIRGLNIAARREVDFEKNDKQKVKVRATCIEKKMNVLGWCFTPWIGIQIPFRLRLSWMNIYVVGGWRID